MTEPHQAGPHPSAPQDIADDFPRLRKLFESGPHFDASKLKPIVTSSSTTPSASPDAVDDLHELPRRFWDTPVIRWSEPELDAVQVRSCWRLLMQSGGASAFP